MSIQPETEYFPPVDRDYRAVESTVNAVTLLEDRAQVRRLVSTKVEKGLNRLAVFEVAPVLQDVSLHAEVRSGTAQVVDLRVRRAMRIRRRDKPEEVREIEEEIERQLKQFHECGRSIQRSANRYGVMQDMLQKGVEEIPQDASWGLVNPQSWHETFSTLTKRSRDLRNTIVEESFRQRDLAQTIGRAARRRRRIDRPDHELVAWIELNLEAEERSEIELSLGYIVPNALWRPMHSARLLGDKMAFTCSAAVWQNTGEDWQDADLTFSTARSSLGTEPPLLSDDLLRAQRRSDELRVEAREVTVQKAGVDEPGEPPGPPSGAVELPGVDDGGEIQNLRPSNPSTIPSDGSPTFIPLFNFESPVQTSLVAAPEVTPRVLFKSVQRNLAPGPILAGPVELVRAGEVVGWSRTLFVSPNEAFELGFGPQDELRITRETKLVRDRVDEVDKCRHRRSRVRLWLSNLGDDEHEIDIVERIPVSEIEQVKVSLHKKTTGHPQIDDDGFCRWKVKLAPHQHEQLTLVWELTISPDVEGL